MSRRTRHELNLSGCSIVIETDNSRSYYETPYINLKFYVDDEQFSASIEEADEIQELIDSLELAKKELL